LALLAKQPEIADCPYYFTSDGKHALGKLSGVTGWRLHDTRRVCRSLLSRIGVPNDVAEMCLGHTLPTLRKTYDLHNHYQEKKHAFEALAAEIARIIDPPAADVIPLRR